MAEPQLALKLPACTFWDKWKKLVHDSHEVNGWKWHKTPNWLNTVRCFCDAQSHLFSLSLSLNKNKWCLSARYSEIKELTLFTLPLWAPNLSIVCLIEEGHGRADVPPPLNSQCPGKNRGGGGCRKCLHVIAGFKTHRQFASNWVSWHSGEDLLLHIRLESKPLFHTTKGGAELKSAVFGWFKTVSITWNRI